MRNIQEVGTMRMSKHARALALCIFVALGLGLLRAPSANAQVLTTLYSFCSQGGSNCTDGDQPYAGLVQGSDGNFYGTTLEGGAHGDGTVFKISPSGTLTTLYSFCSQSGCTDGENPWAGLVQGSDGNFYGTTYGGGTYGDGTVFKITPSGTLTTLYSFCSQRGCTDGDSPVAGLVQGTDGNFYGTTVGGGANGPYYGTIFKITPSGGLTTLHSFRNGDGAAPHAGLVQGSDGNFYGTTEYGGANGDGTVFNITPSGTLTRLYSFCAQSGCPDGENPWAGLVQGGDGNFYGTTYGGGAIGYGAVFKINPTTLAFTTLYSFCSQSGCPDGVYPYAGLVQGTDGNFYGTTELGGRYTSGTAFKITPGGSLTTLYTFCSQGNCTDGSDPFAGLVQGSDGNFYGTTYAGGANGLIYGTVFRLSAGVPVANVSPDSLTFGDQDLGTTSPPQPVTLSNTGTVALTVSGISTSGDFAETDNCNGSVAAGGSCTINVTFTPSGTGIRSGKLTVTDNSNNVPGSQQTVALRGTGINPGASLSPTSLSFGSQVINTTSAARKVTLTSSGTSALNITSITTSGDYTQSNNCPASLPVGQKCTVMVTFTPTVLGADNGSLTFVDNAANSPQTVALSGTGILPVTLSPSSANFGNVAINTAGKPRNFILKNNQSVKLNISSIGFTGLNASDFSQTGCGSSLGANSSCAISVTFTPSALGPESATLTVEEDAPAPFNTLSSSVSGTGVADVTLSPASANFGNVPQATGSNPKNFTLKNNQLATLSVAISFTGPNAGDFSEIDTCGGGVPGRSSCTITVTFTPSLIGPESATLAVSDNASPPYNSLSVSLNGTGIPQAIVSPTSLTFAAQKVGTSSPAKNVTLKNNLSSALAFTTTFTGADPGDYSASNNCSGSVAAKSTCTIGVTFSPTAKGTRTATLNVFDSANNSPQTVSLTGTGK